MKERKLKAKLCRPSGIIGVLRVIVGIVSVIAPFFAIPMLFSIAELGWGLKYFGPTIFTLGIIVSMLLLVVPIIAGGYLLTKAFAGIGSVKELRTNGRMSCEYLERTGLLEAAAEEYFGRDRYACRLRRKGWKFHRYSHRKNVLTPNFIFIMSDNVVLTYDEVKKARFLRVEMRDRGKTRYCDTFSLQMADGTEIALFSSLLNGVLINYEKEMIRRQGIVTEVAQRILAKNPDCEISRIEGNTRVVSFELFTPYYR